MYGVKADGWTKLQDELSSHGFSGSEFFTIAFLFLGHFIFTNLFIGVIIMVRSLHVWYASKELHFLIQNIHSATQDFEEGQREEKERFIKASASSGV